MQTTIMVNPDALDQVRLLLSEAEDITEVNLEPRHQMDAKDIIALVFEYANHENAILFFAFLLGNRTRFQIDHDGVRVEVRNLKTLAKLWKAWRSVDDRNATDSIREIETN